MSGALPRFSFAAVDLEWGDGADIFTRRVPDLLCIRVVNRHLIMKTVIGREGRRDSSA